MEIGRSVWIIWMAMNLRLTLWDEGDERGEKFGGACTLFEVGFVEEYWGYL